MLLNLILYRFMMFSTFVETRKNTYNRKKDGVN